LSYLCQKAGKRLRDSGLYARTVSVTLRFANFRTIDRGRTLPEETDLDSIILATAKSLFSSTWDGAAMLRLVGVALSSFTSASGQLDLIDAGRREKLERLARAADRLRDRFGFSKIQLGGSLGKDDE
jgi:DNA polymerase IV